jgi:hypothetical protein
MRKKRDTHFLSILCMFKNESHIIKEWVQHYMKEGVDHFYLLDNGSTDNYLKEIENNFSNISIIHDTRPGTQGFLYTDFVRSKLITSEWLLVVDMDEFVYAKNGFNTIKDFLKQKCEKYNQIIIPMAVFTSNNYIQQPSSVIKSFTERKRASKLEKTKAIIRVVDPLEQITMMVCAAHIPGITVASDLKRTINTDRSTKIKTTDILREASEDIFRDSFLMGNHYTIQSYDMFWSKLDRYAGHSIHAYCDKRDCRYCRVPEAHYKRVWGLGHRGRKIEDDILATKEYNE